MTLLLNPIPPKLHTHMLSCPTNWGDGFLEVVLSKEFYQTVLE